VRAVNSHLSRLTLAYRPARGQPRCSGLFAGMNDLAPDAYSGAAGLRNPPILRIARP
jgi:hypothetical protein